MIGNHAVRWLVAANLVAIACVLVGVLTGGSIVNSVAAGLIAFALTDRLLARRRTGSWLGTPGGGDSRTSAGDAER